MDAAAAMLIRCFRLEGEATRLFVCFFFGVFMSGRVFLLQVFGGTDGVGERTMRRLKVERMLVARATLRRSRTYLEFH